MLNGASKWGNDDDYVDLLGKEVIEFACREMMKYETPFGGRWLSGVHQPHQVAAGKGLGATPNGRKAGEPLAITLSPASGTDKRGPTAILNSAAKIDPRLCQWNSAVTLRFHPTAVSGREGLSKFEGLVRTFLSLGGIQLQMNVLSTDVLRAAQRDPQRYRDLVVRVWGFSAYFIDLTKDYQEEIIARTEHVF